MKNIHINPSDLSLIFWNKILNNAYLKQISFRSDFFSKIDSLDELRSQSTYNTGSISSTTAWLLFSICLYYKPQTILEIGSFIGKSTFSMAFAADTYNKEKESEIYCCDYSNEIIFPKLTKTKITQFHKTKSTLMFRTIDKKIKIDLIHIDGRVQSKDFEIMKDRISENTLIIFDDYEGIEKGTINWINLINNGVLSRDTHCLINPIQNQVAKSYHLIEPSNTAVVIPISSLRFTPQ